MKYQQPFGISDPDAAYVNGWVKDGIDGSIPPALAFEQPMRELVAMITNGGFTPSNTDLDQVPKGIRSGLYNYLVDTGPTNAMVVTPSLPLEAYNEGLPVRVKVGHTNTGPTTLNVSGLGPVLVVKANGSTLSAGDLAGGQVLDVIYDGVNFQISNFMAVTGGQTITGGFRFAPYNGGTISSGTFTPDAYNGNYQYITNNGAFTLGVPTSDCALDLLVTNGATAGIITAGAGQGWSISASVGDPLTTTNTQKFIISIRRINGIATYTVKALQ